MEQSSFSTHEYVEGASVPVPEGVFVELFFFEKL